MRESVSSNCIVAARPRRFCFHLLFLLLALFFAFDSAALDFAPPYKARFWQPDENPFRNMAEAITQTDDGFIWIGTQEGLARFDGEHFEFFSPPPSDNAQGRRVSALAPSEHGGLWVATGQGLFNFQDGKWTAQAMPRELVAQPFLSLFATREGEVWAGTRTGLARRHNGLFILVGDIASQSLAEKYAGGQSIRSIAKNESGEIWIAAGNDLVEVKNGVPTRNESLLQFQPYFIRAVCCTRDGGIWAGTHSGLIRLKNGAHTQFTKSNGLPDDIITAVYEDRRGNLWVGTFNGLCRFSNGKFVVETKSGGEPYDQIFCFFEDREDNLWVGAKDGLYQLNAQAFTTYSAHHGLGHKNIMSVHQDNNGAIWVGTWGGGLHCLHDEKMTVYSKTNHLAAGNDMILAIQSSREGSLWFGEDYSGGLYRMKDGEVQFFGAKQGLPSGAVRALFEDHRGRIWVGHASAGLGFLERNRLKFYGSKQGLPTNNIRCILETGDYQLWIGTEAGLVLRTNDTFTTFTTADGLSDDFIFALYEDREQNLWVGTDQGLNRLKGQSASGERRTDAFRAYTSRHGLIDHAIVEILEDDLGHLWLATRRGIFRVSKKELDDLDAGRITKVSCAAFGRDDGMKSQICVGVAKPSAIKTRDGRLWFATTKGLAVTDPKLQIAKNEKQPPVLIRKIVADKQIVASDTASHHLTIAPGRGELEFHYTALSYTVPEKNRFKYRLDNFDADWVDAGVRRVAYYNNIPAGDYTFRVIASNNEGVWSSAGSSVRLQLQPHFWQTLWFKFTIGIAGVSCVTGVTRYVTRRRMHLRIRRLEEQHAIERERARIAKDIHDDLGASLTRIAFLGELAETDRAKPEAVSGYVQRIVAAARDTVRSLDEIVWAVNPRNDTLDGLMEYIVQFVHEFFQNTPVRCRLDLPDEVPSIPLSSEMRHNIFLVVKEALNNSLKHANATSVSVAGKLSNQHVEIEISDDGRGFDSAGIAPNHLGNGLENMRRRIEELDGCFEITSAMGKGTRLRLRVPLSKSFHFPNSRPPSHFNANRETQPNA